ncbi:MAG: PGF-pre-PGF domain-containing protein [Candidatus Methanoperedens sp.]|nr:PGF-pre-PGF domain-containing protein [Candidatus Methanoperedens sp.]
MKTNYNNEGHLPRIAFGTTILALLLLAGGAGAAPFAYITNGGSSNVSVIDTATNTVVASVPVGSLPGGVAVNPAGTLVYVANRGSGTVSVIDTATNTVTATVNLGGTPSRVAVNPAGTRVYVTNSGTNNVSVIDTTTNNVIASVPAGNAPGGMAINPAGTLVYVVNYDSNLDRYNLSVIDTATNTVTATVIVGWGSLEVAVNPAGTRVYVTASGTNPVSVIDTATNTVTATVNIGVSSSGVAVNPAGTRVYVANSGTNRVSVIDTATNTITANVTVGGQPEGVAVNPAGTRVYVANYDSNTVSVINTTTNAVTATVAVGSSPKAIGKFIGPQSAGGNAPSFVTAHPIRALTGSGAATRVPTNVSFYYNGSIIRVNVSLNQSGLTVSGDFSPVGNGTISTSDSYLNASNEYIYTLTATAGDVGVGAQPITITATNTSTSASNTSVFIALMNIDPLAYDTTFGGTNWTEIEDFTHTTLTFQKFNDSNHSIRIGKLEFLDPMNLADNTTATALQNLGDNLNMAATSMNLNSAADALAAMNVSSRLSMYNLTMFTSSPGILMNGVPVVMSGQTSGGGVSGYGWYPNYTLVFTVSHWTTYDSDGQPPVVTFQPATPADGSTNTTGNVTIQVSLNENGTARLNWQGVNETMTGIAPDTDRNFSINKTGLLSGNYTFRVYANDSVGNPNATEARIITIDRNNATNIADLGYINTTNATVTTAIILTAPDTNVTVDVPVGTVARNASGGALTNITTDSIADVGSSAKTAASNASLSFLGKNLSLGPEGATFVPDIQIRFNYTHADLPEGVLEGNLKVKWYNKTSGVWDTLTPYDYNTTANYIIVNVSHFSTFALLGTVTSGGGGSNTGSGSSGGSSGGGGVVTGESFDNIAKSESNDKDLVANTPVTYTFNAPELGVYEIAFTDKENELGITLRVEDLKGTSKQVTAEALGTVYKNVNILAGTSRMKEALIRFRVENSWLGSNSLAGSDVKMLHWDGSQWTQLETAQTTKDDTYTYYEAKTDSLSPFAISGIKGGVIVPTATPVVTETQAMPTGTGTPSPAPTKKVPAFEFALTVAILSVAYLFGRKRR